MTDQSLRILIIEDKPDSVSLLLDYLNGMELDILVAVDPEDGYSKAVMADPDLILLDISMPKKDGFEVCRQLKQTPRTWDIPVIFLSARIGLEDKLKGFAAGGVDYITKPFSEEEVMVRVKAHVHTKQRMRALEAAAAQRALDEAGARANPEEELFIKTVTVLEARMASPPGLIELARSLGTNERKLTQIFRRKVGMTVFDYLTELRLDTARRLLEGSAMQIQLIADRVGYSNAGDFTRAFRRRFDVSPREYRKALGSSVEDDG